MSVLDIVLSEEYNRLSRKIHIIEKEMKSLPKGYISKKKIKNHSYYYLQYRENNKIVSKYIKQSEVEAYQVLIDERKSLELNLKELQKNKKKLEKVL